MCQCVSGVCVCQGMYMCRCVSVCTYVIVCVCARHCLYMCTCASVYVHVCLCEEADGQGLTVCMSFLTVVRIVIFFPASVPFSYL